MAFYFTNNAVSLINTAQSGLNKITIDEFRVGDPRDGGEVIGYAPDGTETDLACGVGNEKLVSSNFMIQTISQDKVKVICPLEVVDTFEFAEVGLFDDLGNLLGIESYSVVRNKVQPSAVDAGNTPVLEIVLEFPDAAFTIDIESSPIKDSFTEFVPTVDTVLDLGVLGSAIEDTNRVYRFIKTHESNTEGAFEDTYNGFLVFNTGDEGSRLAEWVPSQHILLGVPGGVPRHSNAYNSGTVLDNEIRILFLDDPSEDVPAIFDAKPDRYLLTFFEEDDPNRGLIREVSDVTIVTHVGTPTVHEVIFQLTLDLPITPAENSPLKIWVPYADCNEDNFLVDYDVTTPIINGPSDVGDISAVYTEDSIIFTATGAVTNDPSASLKNLKYYWTISDEISPNLFESHEFEDLQLQGIDSQVEFVFAIPFGGSPTDLTVQVIVEDASGTQSDPAQHIVTIHEILQRPDAPNILSIQQLPSNFPEIDTEYTFTATNSGGPVATWSWELFRSTGGGPFVSEGQTGLTDADTAAVKYTPSAPELGDVLKLVVTAVNAGGQDSLDYTTLQVVNVGEGNEGPSQVIALQVINNPDTITAKTLPYYDRVDNNTFEYSRNVVGREPFVGMRVGSGDTGSNLSTVTGVTDIDGDNVRVDIDQNDVALIPYDVDYSRTKTAPAGGNVHPDRSPSVIGESSIIVNNGDKRFVIEYYTEGGYIYGPPDGLAQFYYRSFEITDSNTISDVRDTTTVSNVSVPVGGPLTPIYWHMLKEIDDGRFVALYLTGGLKLGYFIFSVDNNGNIIKETAGKPTINTISPPQAVFGGAAPKVTYLGDISIPNEGTVPSIAFAYRDPLFVARLHYVVLAEVSSGVLADIGTDFIDLGFYGVRTFDIQANKSPRGIMFVIGGTFGGVIGFTNVQEQVHFVRVRNPASAFSDVVFDVYTPAITRTAGATLTIEDPRLFHAASYGRENGDSLYLTVFSDEQNPDGSEFRVRRPVLDIPTKTVNVAPISNTVNINSYLNSQVGAGAKLRVSRDGCFLRVNNKLYMAYKVGSTDLVLVRVQATLPVISSNPVSLSILDHVEMPNPTSCPNPYINGTGINIMENRLVVSFDGKNISDQIRTVFHTFTDLPKLHLMSEEVELPLIDVYPDVIDYIQYTALFDDIVDVQVYTDISDSAVSYALNQTVNNTSSVSGNYGISPDLSGKYGYLKYRIHLDDLNSVQFTYSSQEVFD